MARRCSCIWIATQSILVTLTVAVPHTDWKVSTGLPRLPMTFASGNGGGNGHP